MKNNCSDIKYMIFYTKSSLLKKSCFFLFLCFTLLHVACGDDDDEIIAPKPRAYFRLEFPEKNYIKYDSLCPFTFEFPNYAVVEDDKGTNVEPCWLNMNFPQFNGTLHLSYKPVNNNLKGYLDDTYLLASKHQVKASGIKQQLVKNDTTKVYGLIYDIEGNVASSFQFFLTDSTKHFIRGALYFNVAPNTDSIAPVLTYIKKDIYNLINTFEWKNNTSSLLKTPAK